MRGGVGSYGSPSTPSAEIAVRMASGSGSFMSLSCGVFGPVRSARVGRAGGQGRVGKRGSPRRQESQSVPVPPGDTARSGHCSSGVCALCPRAVGQGATLDAKTPKAEPTGCGRCSGARTQKPLRVHPFEGCAFPCFAKHRDSPCLLVKGTDCAGVTRARGACGGPGLCVFCFSVLMGRSNTLTSPSGLARSFAGCRVASVGTCCPTYLPRALCSPIPASPLAQLSAGEGRRRPGRLVGCM